MNPKIISSIASFILLSLGESRLFASTYYIDPSAKYNGDGSRGTPASATGHPGAFNAWPQNLHSFGDRYYQKCGTTFTVPWQNGILITSNGGGLGNETILGAYYLGASNNAIIGVSGDKPILTGSSVLPNWRDESHWRNEGSNIWSCDFETTSPHRLWIDGSERLMAGFNPAVEDAFPHGIGRINPNADPPTYWCHETYPPEGGGDTGRRLYVYSVGNPATAYSAMEGLQGSDRIFSLRGSDYVIKVETTHLPPDNALDRPMDGLRYLLMGFYRQVIPNALRNKSVWMLHDIDFSRYARLVQIEAKPARKLRLQLHRYMLRHWQPRYAEHFNRCITVSETDRQLLLAANPRLQVEVAPNGVDTQMYRPLPQVGGPSALIFVGNMDYMPCVNAVVYFCQEVLPRLRRAIAEVEMWIVGINPRLEVKALAGNGVHVTGRVDDVRPYYERSTVCVVPLHAGGGTRIKILEAMALSRPVVSTSIGCDGLEVVAGEHLLIADTPEQFAVKTICLLTDAALRRRLTHNARQLAVNRYDWEVIAKKLIKIYTATAEQPCADGLSLTHQEDIVS